MEFFYIIVSLIAVVVLILVLTFIGLMIQNGNKTQTFPPNTSQCPDLWIPDGSYCHYNGLNNGTYVSDTSGVNSNSGNFLGDNPTTAIGSSYINKYDFSQMGSSGSKYYSKISKIESSSSTSNTDITSYPMNKVPFFTFGGLINTNSTTINTNDPQWEKTGISSNCAKKKWATSNNIQWSGISQLNSC